MKFDLDILKSANPKQFTHILAVDSPAIDYGYIEEEKGNPSNVPYFAEMTIGIPFYQDDKLDYFQVTSNVIIYPIFDDERKFIKWNIKTMQIDDITNSDMYNATHDCTEQGYGLYNDVWCYENADELAQRLCDMFDEDFNTRSNWEYVNIEYPNGLELIV